MKFEILVSNSGYTPEVITAINFYNGSMLGGNLIMSHQLGYMSSALILAEAVENNQEYLVSDGAITKFILCYGRTSDTLGWYNKQTKGDSILMTFFYYKLHMELSQNNN